MTILPTGGARKVGGWTFDRQTLRTKLPNARWFLYAAGLVNSVDGNALVVRVRYVKDNGTSATLLTGSYSDTALTKKVLGPFDLFSGAGGVPTNENIIAVEVEAQKSTGLDGLVRYWTTWVRALPSRA